MSLTIQPQDFGSTVPVPAIPGVSDTPPTPQVQHTPRRQIDPVLKALDYWLSLQVPLRLELVSLCVTFEPTMDWQQPIDIQCLRLGAEHSRICLQQVDRRWATIEVRFHNCEEPEGAHEVPTSAPPFANQRSTLECLPHITTRLCHPQTNDFEHLTERLNSLAGEMRRLVVAGRFANTTGESQPSNATAEWKAAASTLELEVWMVK